MGQKVHPVGFRLGSYKTWLSIWQSEREYSTLLHEDLAIRKLIGQSYRNAGVSKVEIERGGGEVSVVINTSRPGIVIGRGGQRVNEMRTKLENLAGKKIKLDIREIREPDLDAYLVARNIADQLERRISYRRAMKRALSQTMNAGAQGIKIRVSGRLGGHEIARCSVEHQGSVPLHTLCADVDYGLAEAHTNTGKIGVKAWIFKGLIKREPPHSVEESAIEPTAETVS